MTPTQTAEPQHMAALAKGNRIRLARAATKRLIAVGQMDVVDILRAIPEEFRTMPLGDLLRARRRWGRTRARKFCNRMAINENRTLERLTERQVDALARELSR